MMSRRIGTVTVGSIDAYNTSRFITGTYIHLSYSHVGSSVEVVRAVNAPCGCRTAQALVKVSCTLRRN